MKAVLVAAGFALLASGAFAASHVVQGHVTKDGTYVAPHYQTNPDSTKLNNYSTQGNVNPHTGAQGTVNPYQQPSPYNPYKRP